MRKTLLPETEQPTSRTFPFGAPGGAGLFAALQAQAAARRAAHLSGKPFGPVTSLPLLDKALGGALVPGMHVVHGSPGTGKTAFALQIATTCGTPALFVTTEMTPVELLLRHTARVSRTFLGRLKTGELSADAVVGLAQAAAAAAPLVTILDATEEPATLQDVVIAAKISRAQVGSDSPLLVVVDSVHTWTSTQKHLAGISEYERLTEGLSAMRLLAKHLDCAVLAIAERSKKSRDGGQDAAAGHRGFEYGAETVIGLDALKSDDTHNEKDETRETEIKVSIHKNRHGSAGKPIMVLFQGGQQRFREDGFQGGVF